MHIQLEIIMPPTDDMETAIEKIMAPFNENKEDASNAFWDFYVIGGRFAGTKLQDTLDPEKMNAFHAALTERKVTVSSVQCGKQSLQPESQIPAVDALWHEHFPAYKGKHCPLFSHSNDQYSGEDRLNGDVMVYRDVTDNMKAGRVIIAKEDEAQFMVSQDFWNGVNHIKTTWSGTIIDAVKIAKDSWRKIQPEDDWLVITVDYHS